MAKLNLKTVNKKTKDQLITFVLVIAVYIVVQIMVAAGTDSFSGLVRSNETAGFIVECLKKTVTEDDIVHAMTDAYDAPEAVVRRDVKGILKKLDSIGAIEY